MRTRTLRSGDARSNVQNDASNDLTGGGDGLPGTWKSTLALQYLTSSVECTTHDSWLACGVMVTVAAATSTFTDLKSPSCISW